MTCNVHSTSRDLEKMADKIVERTSSGQPLSKSAALNLITSTLLGSGHDWAAIKNAGEDVVSQRFRSAQHQVQDLSLSTLPTSEDKTLFLDEFVQVCSSYRKENVGDIAFVTDTLRAPFKFSINRSISFGSALEREGASQTILNALSKHGLEPQLVTETGYKFISHFEEFEPRLTANQVAAFVNLEDTSAEVFQAAVQLIGRRRCKWNEANLDRLQRNKSRDKTPSKAAIDPNDWLTILISRNPDKLIARTASEAPDLFKILA